MSAVQYIQAKSILSKIRQTDSFFGIAYNMNLYRGCQHGCIYCDTRSECYGVGDISQISVKQNAIELLVGELRSKKQKATIGTGSMNDPYMPMEKEMGLTRRALQTISNFRFPVHIITKSDLIVRDLDVIKEISKVYAAVSITITTADDNLASKIEPYAPVTSARFRALEQLSAAGVYTGITLMPLLPYINDTVQNLRDILNRAKDSGASYVIPMFGLTLRKGSRDYFYQALDAQFPGIKANYQARFGEQYECFSSHWKELENEFQKHDLPRRMKFYEPQLPRQFSLFNENL
ncbi:MAG: radical SAM protein [Bacteroides sp.]|nr:radical SAM protein [Bacteroides sp.]